MSSRTLAGPPQETHPLGQNKPALTWLRILSYSEAHSGSQTETALVRPQATRLSKRDCPHEPILTSQLNWPLM